VRNICIKIWVIWKFKFSLKSRGFPQNHRSLSLNLRFKVADLPHLSWNLLQGAWFPPVPQKSPIDVLYFPLFVLGFVPKFVRDVFHNKSDTILHHLVIRAKLIVLLRLVSDFFCSLICFACWVLVLSCIQRVQWRILTRIVGGAKIIHQKFIYLIIVTNKIKLNT